MRKVLTLSCVVFVSLSLASCTNKSIQKTYWKAGTTVAYDEERKGNPSEAEKEYIMALQRANRELDDEQIASSLHNLGAFYRRQDRGSESIHYLSEALKMKEKLYGQTNEKTGRTLAELSAIYAIEGNFFEGREYANRLKSISNYYTGEEASFVDEVLKAYAIDMDKYTKDVSMIKPIADSGDPEAKFQLASIYFDGPYAKEMLPEIIGLYEKSANQGYNESQYYLGVIYDKGRGVAKDDVTARKWYRIAAENKHKIAQFNYAVFLLQGRGGEIDEGEGWNWMEKSSLQGYEAAQRALVQKR